jgi:hypothetical protein
VVSGDEAVPDFAAIPISDHGDGAMLESEVNQRVPFGVVYLLLPGLHLDVQVVATSACGVNVVDAFAARCPASYWRLGISQLQQHIRVTRLIKRAVARQIAAGERGSNVGRAGNSLTPEHLTGEVVPVGLCDESAPGCLIGDNDWVADA